MKTYKYKNTIIKEDELTEIQLPKVGDRFRVKVDNYYETDLKVGSIIEIESLRSDHFTIIRHNYGFDYGDYLNGLQPIPSPPVCPPELLPLPDGFIYVGKGGHINEKDARPTHYSDKHTKRWEQRVVRDCGLHFEDFYATTAGDSCHRAQEWFDESQVPMAKVEPYPSPEPTSDSGNITLGSPSRDALLGRLCLKVFGATPVYLEEEASTITRDEINHLGWIYDRLRDVHGENSNYDYMLKLKSVIRKISKQPNQ